MLTPLFFCWMFVGAASFSLQTEKSLTAMRGGSISLPCNFSVPAHAVYWYQHNFTGAPDDGASLVARDYRGITDPIPGIDRFSISRDYSLIIRNITVHDETTYSCLVYNMDLDEERGYTDLRVIALAEPLEPIIESCKVTAPGRCIYMYTVGETSPENITLVCVVYNVRPPSNLTWIRSDGKVPDIATHKTLEKDGLFNISSQIQISKSNLDHNYTCQAEGEGVKGTSSTIITIEDNVTVSHDRGIVGGRITSIVIGAFLLLIIIVFVSCLIYKKRGYPRSSRAGILPNQEQLIRELHPPEGEEEAITKTELNQKIEAYENEKKKQRAALEKERLNTQGDETEMLDLLIIHNGPCNTRRLTLPVNQHMTLDNLKNKVCSKLGLKPSLIYITYDGHDLSHRGKDNLKTAGLTKNSVVNVSEESFRRRKGTGILQRLFFWKSHVD